MKLPIELSDDRHRGTMPHIRTVLEKLTELRANPFKGCDVAACREPAAIVIESRTHPRAVCRVHAEAWRTMMPLDRRMTRRTWWPR